MSRLVPDFIHGVVNLRANVVPIISLAEKFDLDVNEITLNKEPKAAHILCRKDKLRKAIDLLLQRNMERSIDIFKDRYKDIPLIWLSLL
jgi:hypothetical protein